MDWLADWSSPPLPIALSLEHPSYVTGVMAGVALAILVRRLAGAWIDR